MHIYINVSAYSLDYRVLYIFFLPLYYPYKPKYSYDEPLYIKVSELNLYVSFWIFSHSTEEVKYHVVFPHTNPLTLGESRMAVLWPRSTNWWLSEKVLDKRLTYYFRKVTLYRTSCSISQADPFSPRPPNNTDEARDICHRLTFRWSTE